MANDNKSKNTATQSAPKFSPSVTRFNFDFVGKFWLFGGISLLGVILSFVIIGIRGFNYGIDFAGGTEVQVRFTQPVEVSEVRKFTEDLGFKQSQVQKFGTENEYLIRFENPAGATEAEINDALRAMTSKVTSGLKEKFPDQQPEVRRIDSVGPQVGSQLKRNSLLAAFYSLLVILIYVGFRFDYIFAPGAVLCLFHDAIIVLGVWSLIGKEVNVQILASVLTLIGFSLNDTIITYDRIRENQHIMKGSPFPQIVNQSINDMLSRTFLTSFTLSLGLVALYLFAGGVIEDFALSMGIGVIVGVYSSVYVAAPFILIMQRITGKRA